MLAKVRFTRSIARRFPETNMNERMLTDILTFLGLVIAIALGTGDADLHGAISLQ